MPEGANFAGGTTFRLVPRLVAWLENHAGWLAFGLVLLAFLAGVVYSLTLGEQLRFLPDEADYLTLAGNLLAQGKHTLDGLHPTAYRPPGYPILLAGLQALGFGRWIPAVLGLRLVNFALLGLTWLLLYRLLSRIFTPVAGLLAVGLAAVYIVLFYTAGVFYPQTLAAFLLTALLTLLCEHPVSAPLPVSRILLAGLLAGCLVLTLPTFLFIFPVLLAWLVYYRRAWKAAALMAMMVLLITGAWAVRNYLALDAWVFVSTNGGENLLLGNSPQTTANAGTLVDISSFRQQADALGLNEVQRDAYFRQQALDYICAHPVAAARLYFSKFLNYFNYRNQLATQSEASPLRDLAMLFTYVPLLVLAILRLVLSKGKLHPVEVLFALLYLASALVQAVFFTRIRFRLPFDYCLIALAAGFLAQRIQSWLGKAEGKIMTGEI